MSEIATEGEINVNVSALEAFEAKQESAAEPAPVSQATEELESESPPSPDYLAGFRHAAEELGAEIELEPGQPGYIEWAQTQIEAARAERNTLLANANAVVEMATEQGNHALAEYARNILDGLTWQVEQAEYERQAESERRAYEWEAQLEKGSDNISQWIEETSSLVGMDDGSIDNDRVMSIATDAYGQLIEEHGKEAADAMVPELIEKTVAHVSNENEEAMARAYEAAKTLAKDLGNSADPAEIVSLASEIYPRELYRANGDETEARRAALEAAAKTVSGFTEHSQPLHTNISSFYANLDRALPRAQTPEPLQVQMRDSKGRFIGGTPVAARYAAPPPKSNAEVRAAEQAAVKKAQAAAIKQAFDYLDANARS